MSRFMIEIITLILLTLNMTLPAGYSPENYWLSIIKYFFRHVVLHVFPGDLTGKYAWLNVILVKQQVLMPKPTTPL